MQAGTEGSDDTLQNSVGLVKGHAYTVLGVHKLSRDGTRLVKIRNPWGSEVFHGAWSDDSPNWDQESKKEVGFVNADDGIFWTDIETYKRHFSETYINFNVDEWASDKFLKIND